MTILKHLYANSNLKSPLYLTYYVVLEIYVQIDDPYLKAVFAFLTTDSKDKEYRAVLDDALSISLPDRIGVCNLYAFLKVFGRIFYFLFVFVVYLCM